MTDPSISPRTAARAVPAGADTRALRDERIRLMKFVTLFGFGGTERQFVNLGLALDSQRFALRAGRGGPTPPDPASLRPALATGLEASGFGHLDGVAQARPRSLDLDSLDTGCR